MIAAWAEEPLAQPEPKRRCSAREHGSPVRLSGYCYASLPCHARASVPVGKGDQKPRHPVAADRAGDRRHPRHLSPGTGTELAGAAVRASGRCRAGKLERVEQCGHRPFGLCRTELYLENPDGSISTDKAVQIAEQFEVARQFRAHEVRAGRLGAPNSFINATPHMSLVGGAISSICASVRRRWSAIRCSTAWNIPATRNVSVARHRW